jgi:hypothetical protein
VIGEKSLAITDNTPFHRRVSQNISSTAFVKLPDGYYNLSAMIRCSGAFTAAFMYAKSKGKNIRYPISSDNKGWKKITLGHIKVRKGKTEIGFEAVGEAGAMLLVDDVELIRE